MGFAGKALLFFVGVGSTPLVHATTCGNILETIATTTLVARDLRDLKGAFFRATEPEKQRQLLKQIDDAARANPGRGNLIDPEAAPLFDEIGASVNYTDEVRTLAVSYAHEAKATADPAAARLVEQKRMDGAIPKDGRQEAKDLVARNDDFQTKRPLYGGSSEYGARFESYKNMLPEYDGGFVYSLQNLKSGETWVDLGAGEARAPIEFLNGWSKRVSSNNELPNVVAMSFVKPDAPDLDIALEKYRGRFAYIESPVESLSLKKIKAPPAKIVTDVVGPWTYTQDLTRTIQATHSLQPVGGDAFISMGQGSTFILTDPKATLADFFMMPATSPTGRKFLVKQDRPFQYQAGKVISVPDFINAYVKGYRVESVTKKIPVQAVVSAMHIKKTSEELYVPELELLWSDGRTKRVFRLKNAEQVLVRPAPPDLEAAQKSAPKPPVSSWGLEY